MLCKAGLCLLVISWLTRSAQAASATWTGATDGTFGNGMNWSTGAAPGTTSVALTTNPGTSSDVATFATSGNTSISIASSTANVGIGLISFDGGNTSGSISAFTFGNSATTGTAPAFYSGGVQVGSTATGRDAINILGTVTTTATTAETFNAPVFLTQAAGFGNDAVSPNVTLNIAGNVTPSASAASLALRLNGNNTGNNTVSGLIADSGSTTVSVLKGAVGGLNGLPGTGTWILSNNSNTFTGGVALQGGILSVATIGNSGSASALGTNSSINFGANVGGAAGAVGGGTLLYTGAGESSNKAINLFSSGSITATIDQSGTGALVLSGGITGVGASGKTQTVTLQGNTSGAGTISGAINNPTAGGTLGVIKTGTGTWTLSGSNNTYSGATTINGGTLNVTSSITTSSGVAINNGGTLTGTGSVPAITLAAGGNLTPGTAGAATGTLTGTSLAFNSGGILTFVLSSTDHTSNLLILSGAFTKSGGATTGYNFNLSGGAVGSIYDLVNFNSTTFTSTSVFTNTGSTPGTFSLATGGELTFTVSAVPEPSTWAFGMMMFGLVGMAGLRRGKNRRSAAC